MQTAPIIVIESQYLPCLEYFVVIRQAKSVVIDAHEHYVKQTYRSRCEILGANGVMALSVPVVGGRKKIAMREIAIDNSQHWQKIHWRSITSAYGKAPFFECYCDYFAPYFERRYSRLIDLNHDVLSCCFKLLSWSVDLSYSEGYVDGHNFDYQNIKSYISPKTPFGTRHFYADAPYIQLFGSEFAPNLSIIDLIMCQGPASNQIIEESTQPSLLQSS